MNWRKYFIKPVFAIGRFFGRDNLYNKISIIDPFFEYGRNKFIKNTNWDFCDKFNLKENSGELNTPKTFFTFDKAGNILSGKKPMKGLAVIKYNLSIRSDSVEIINASDINRVTLRRFAQQSLLKDKKDWNDRDVKGLDQKIFYCEDIINDITAELKIYIDLKGKNYISWEKNNLESHMQHKEFRALWFNEKIEQEYHPTHNTLDLNTITENQRKIIASGQNEAFKIIKKVGHFARVDFIVSGNKLYFSEVTPNPSGFFYDKHQKGFKNIPNEEKKRFIEFVSNGLKEKRNV